MKTRRRLLRKQQHRKLAASLFNRTWDLMEKKRRSAEKDDEMVRSAHASRFHWEQIGTAKNFAVGEWQLARVTLPEFAFPTLTKGMEDIYRNRRAFKIMECTGVKQRNCHGLHESDKEKLVGGLGPEFDPYDEA